MFDVQAFLEQEKYGPKVWYQGHYFKDDEWRVIGDTSPLKHRKMSDVVQKLGFARMDDRVTDVMIVKVETVCYSDLATKTTFTKTDYTAIVDV